MGDNVKIIEHENENGDIIYLELKIRGESFMLDRVEVHALFWAIYNAFDGMLDPSELQVTDYPVI